MSLFWGLRVYIGVYTHNKLCQTLSLPWVRDVCHVHKSRYFVSFIHTQEITIHMVIIISFHIYRKGIPWVNVCFIIIIIIITKKESFARYIKWMFMSFEWSFGTERERENFTPFPMFKNWRSKHFREVLLFLDKVICRVLQRWAELWVWSFF